MCLYWFEPTGNDQPVHVTFTDTIKPVARGSLTFNSDAFRYIEVVKQDSVTNAKLEGAVFKILDSANNEIGRLTTNAEGYAKSE